MNHARIAHSLVFSSRRVGALEVELRIDGGETSAWTRTGGVLRRLQTFPTFELPAVLLRMTRSGTTDSWKTLAEHHIASASIIRLALADHGRRPPESSVRGMEEIQFPHGEMTLCLCRTRRLAEEVRTLLRDFRPDVRVYEERDIDSAAYDALLGDAVCILAKNARDVDRSKQKSFLFTSLAGSRVHARIEQRVCRECSPAGSGCGECAQTGFSGRTIAFAAG